MENIQNNSHVYWNIFSLLQCIIIKAIHMLKKHSNNNNNNNSNKTTQAQTVVQNNKVKAKSLYGNE
jgi:hypothetical protein